MGKRSILAAALAIALVGAMAEIASAATIGLVGNVSWQPSPGSGNATRLNSGAGGNLAIDNSLNPFVYLQIAVTTSQGDHQGVSQVVYDMHSPEAESKGYFLTPAFRAFTGYNNVGVPAPQTVLASTYDAPQPSVAPANYGGGWGWTNSGLPFAGTTPSAGLLSGAGDSLPLTWSGDNSAAIPGIQSFARMGIGQGAHTAPTEDPVLGGQTLGFGTDIVNAVGGGDGSWWFHTVLLDTTGWDKQTYTFNLSTLAGNVLRTNDATGNPINYAVGLMGGFREAVTGADLIGGSFSFTLIPEPATLGLVALSGLALIRRRR